MSIMYLTGAEQALFAKLPEDLRGSWEGTIEEETQTNFESAEELTNRMEIVSYEKFPRVKDFVEKVNSAAESGGDLSSVSFDEFPSDAIPVLLYSIGASGICALIELSLGDPTKLDAADIDGIAVLSRARHQILQKNPKVSA